MQGLYGREKEEISRIAKKISDITLNDLWKRKKEKELEEKFELTKKRSKPLNLVDNFHWYVFMARRKKKLTRHEVAKLLGESETAIKMIENKELPDDSLGLINKLEQFFGIKLKKQDGDEEKKEVEKAIRERLESDSKPDIADLERREEKEHAKSEPVRVLKFDKDSAKNITIADLQRMKEEKEKKEKLRKQSRMKADDLLGAMEKEEKTIEEERWEEESKSSFVGDDVEIE